MHRKPFLRAGLVFLGVALLVLGQTADWLGPPGLERRDSGEFLLSGVGLLLIFSSLVFSRTFNAVRARYLGVASIFLNTVLAFLLINVLLAAVFLVVDIRRIPAAPGGPVEKYGLSTLQRVYPGMSEAAIDQLLTETFRPYTFAPFTVFRETPFSGRFVNVDSAGFRRVENQGPWKPDDDSINIFVFGGSTTFGYGVADEETIPSRLQASLASHGCSTPVLVYNFGRAGYYSTQERILFENLLTEGVRPDLAIFIDGLNDSFRDSDIPDLAPEIAGLFERHQRGPPPLLNLSRLPMARATRRILRQPGAATALADGLERVDGSMAYQERVVDRWLANRRLIESVGETFQIPTLFVWQPIPLYKYDLSQHLFTSPDWEGEGAQLAENAAAVYALMEKKVSVGELTDLIWLGSMQERRAEPLYVDAVHYTSAFSRDVAERLASEVEDRIEICSLG